MFCNSLLNSCVFFACYSSRCFSILSDGQQPSYPSAQGNISNAWRLERQTFYIIQERHRSRALAKVLAQYIYILLVILSGRFVQMEVKLYRTYRTILTSSVCIASTTNASLDKGSDRLKALNSALHSYHAIQPTLDKNDIEMGYYGGQDISPSHQVTGTTTVA